MSRTKRKKLKNNKLLEVGDAQVEKWKKKVRMRPYAAKLGANTMKFKSVKSEYTHGWAKGLTKSDKLITRNANRSLKKSMRQKLKKELKELL